MNEPATILITGAAGFIGFNTAQKLLQRGDRIIGIDNLNDYYDVNLKLSRLSILKKFPNFVFHKIDISDKSALDAAVENEKIDKILNLAAQAGVRYSLINPYSYEKTNLNGFLNVIELARHRKISNFVFASSSSVYGKNKKLPYSEEDRVDNPISMYAATKKADELIAHAYAHLFSLPSTGLRFFTVYGPWGRPDMALFKFTDAIVKNKPIDIYNYGKMKRDFTYIDDIVRGTIAALDNAFDYEIINLGNNKPVDLLYFVECIEKSLGMKAKRNLAPLQPGDVVSTYADISKAQRLLGFQPKMSIEKGIDNFIAWYKEYYKI